MSIPVPPPHNFRGPAPGPGGQGNLPRPIDPRVQQQQQQQQRAPAGQGAPQMQMPLRPQSTRVVDISPPKLMDEAACLKKLITYVAYTIRKTAPNDPKRDKATWAKSEVVEEKLTQEDILKQIKKLNEKGGKTVAEKKVALAPNQQGQVTHLLDDLSAQEQDRNFEWSLAQIDRRERVLKQGLRETVTMTVFVKRSPNKDLNPVNLLQQIERQRHERIMQAERARHEQLQREQQQREQQQREQQQREQQQREQQQQQQQGPPPQGNGFVNIGKKDGKPKAPKIYNVKGGKRGPKKYHSHHSESSYSSDSDSDSDSMSDSDMSSYDTSVSSDSRRDKGYKNKGRRRSYSRYREHRKDYFIDNRAFSPESQYRDARPMPQTRYSVPEVPRTVPVVPAYDPVHAAYQAGKIDADAERLELERERERYASPPQPLVIERPVVIERQIDRPVPVEPRAIVSYGRAKPAYRPEPHRRFADAIPHYEAGRRYESHPRYVDESYEEMRLPRERDDDRFFVSQRERDAEEYIDRDYRRGGLRATEPRVIYTNPNPFAPRRYQRSDSSGGW